MEDDLEYVLDPSKAPATHTLNEKFRALQQSLGTAIDVPGMERVKKLEITVERLWNFIPEILIALNEIETGEEQAIAPKL